ncbi:hypothetical protein [Paenibacillus lutrae]|uniref:Uncharacterized protein n=1 Tax=Paenibacillus lutrae TaxID=2078573 RepID=A0A7X3JY67_9BACL|nr:hypothetical protein [Paenibacillus lutrae]MVO98595.1 hypothetical protein [Paenibacillus lutrae]
MTKYRALLANDIRYAWRDPVLMAALFGPLLLLLLSRYGFPVASYWLGSSYSFNLDEYRGFAASLLMMIIPLLIGMLVGLLMLDERDENVIVYYSVTPFMGRGYLVYRLTLPTLLCIVLSMLFLVFSGFMLFRLGYLLVLILLAMEAPLFALFLAAFAANKVEGLVLSKIGGLFIIGPAVAYFIPNTWQFLGAWVPTYWPAKVLHLFMQNEILLAAIFFLIGLLIHAICLLFMISIFHKKHI